MAVSYTHLDVYKRQILNDYLIITKTSINSEISLRVGDIFLEITEPLSLIHI